MKHIDSFDRFLNEEELSDEELESQETPTHVITKDVVFDGETYLLKFDLVFVDFEGMRLLSMETGMIMDFGDGQMDGYMLALDSPEGKSFLEANRGKITGKNFGF